MQDRKRIFLETELYTSDIPKIFGSFRNLIGESAWTRQAKKVRELVKRHRFRRDYLDSENAVTLALEHCTELVRRHGDIPPKETMNRQIYPAIAFAAHVNSLVLAYPAKKKLLRNRVRAAFSNPEDLRAFLFELRIATHFVKRGKNVRFPEMEGTGNHDLDIADIGRFGLQVECKSFSEDKGRRIHRKDAALFWEALVKQMSPFIRDLSSNIAIVVTVPGRLPTAHSKQASLAQEVAAQLLVGKKHFASPQVRVRIEDLDPDLIPASSDGAEPPFRDLIDTLTSTKNNEAMIHVNKNGNSVVFVVQSQKKDNVLEYAFDTLREAAKQVDSTRPAFLMASFEGISDAQLVDVAQEDAKPTALRIRTSEFLDSESRNHLVGVGFFARSSLTETSSNELDTSGSVYFFDKPDSRFWSEEFTNIVRTSDTAP